MLQDFVLHIKLYATLYTKSKKDVICFINLYIWSKFAYIKDEWPNFNIPGNHFPIPALKEFSLRCHSPLSSAAYQGYWGTAATALFPNRHYYSYKTDTSRV